MTYSLDDITYNDLPGHDQTQLGRFVDLAALLTAELGHDYSNTGTFYKVTIGDRVSAVAANAFQNCL